LPQYAEGDRAASGSERRNLVCRAGKW
jgi:hypothetical protein